MWLFGRRNPPYLRGPHLVLAHVGDDRRVVAGSLADLVDDEVGRQLAVAPGAGTVPGRLLRFGAPAVELGEVGGPALRSDLGHERDQGGQHAFDVAHDRDLDGHVLADLGRVDVDVNDPGVRRESRHVSGHTIVEAHPEGDQQVRRLDGAIGVFPAVHPHEAEAERIRLVHGADAQERVSDRDLGLLGQFPQFFGGVRDQDAVAGQDDRAFGPGRSPGPRA